LTRDTTWSLLRWRGNGRGEGRRVTVGHHGAGRRGRRRRDGRGGGGGRAPARRRSGSGSAVGQPRSAAVCRTAPDRGSSKASAQGELGGGRRTPSGARDCGRAAVLARAMEPGWSQRRGTGGAGRPSTGGHAAAVRGVHGCGAATSGIYRVAASQSTGKRQWDPGAGAGAGAGAGYGIERVVDIPRSRVGATRRRCATARGSATMGALQDHKSVHRPPTACGE